MQREMGHENERFNFIKKFITLLCVIEIVSHNLIVSMRFPKPQNLKILSVKNELENGLLPFRHMVKILIQNANASKSAIHDQLVTARERKIF